jgi:predicted Zn-dependent peptidase
MKFQKTILENGLRIVTVPMPDNPAVTVLVMVEAGSKYEDKHNNGISHFLEHMVFKGTPRRPKAIDISRELDGLGASYNAFTAQEMTGYWAKAEAGHIDKVLDIVSDMYQNPLFDAAEIEKEKGVIIEEIRMYRDLPQRHVHDVLAELLHGDQPAGWNIAGTEENVRSFSREDLLKYRTAHYVASATTVVVAGSFDEKKVISQIEKAFSDIKASVKAGKLEVKEEQKAPAIKAFFKETDQTHLAMAFRSFSMFDERIPVMEVLSTALGQGMSSRLFSKMRDQLGICYYINASNDAYTDHGDLVISAGVDNSRVKEAIQGILGECSRLKDELISTEELKKVKDSITGRIMLGLETSDARAEFFGMDETLKHKLESPEEFISKINAVTAADVEKLAQDIFVNEGLNMAVVGRFKDDSQFKEYFKL